MAKRPRGPVGSNYLTPSTSTEDGFFKVRQFDDETILYEPKAESKEIFLVRRGRVRLYRQRKGGAPAALTAILGPGDLFGELFRPDGTTGSEKAVVSPGAELWGMDGETFRKQMAQRPEFAVEVVQAYAERLAATKQRLWSNSVKDAPSRLAEVILGLVKTHGTDGESGKELKGVTQQEMADLADISRSLASTIINELKNDKVLTVLSGRVLCVQDLETLKTLAAREKYLMVG